jgi:hypothetical protein
MGQSAVAAQRSGAATSSGAVVEQSLRLFETTSER